MTSHWGDNVCLVPMVLGIVDNKRHDTRVADQCFNAFQVDQTEGTLRALRACNPCRSQKRRCDRIEPQCGPCQRSCKKELCKYEPYRSGAKQLPLVEAQEDAKKAREETRRVKEQASEEMQRIKEQVRHLMMQALRDARDIVDTLVMEPESERARDIATRVKQRKSRSTTGENTSKNMLSEQLVTVEWPPSAQKNDHIDSLDDISVRLEFNALYSSLPARCVDHILMLWMEKIEPRKWETYPYKGEVVPHWWPSTVPHKTPRHLFSQARRELWLHLLLPEQSLRERLLQSFKEHVCWSDVLESATDGMDPKKAGNWALPANTTVKDILSTIYTLLKATEVVYERRGTSHTKCVRPVTAPKRGRLGESDVDIDSKRFCLVKGKIATLSAGL